MPTVPLYGYVFNPNKEFDNLGLTIPSAINTPEIKSPIAVKNSEVFNEWDNF